MEFKKFTFTTRQEKKKNKKKKTKPYFSYVLKQA